MSEFFIKDKPFRICGYANGYLVFTKQFSTKDEAIIFFNHCVSGTSSNNYFYEIWDDSNSALLFSTEA